MQPTSRWRTITSNTFEEMDSEEQRSDSWNLILNHGSNGNWKNKTKYNTMEVLRHKTQFWRNEMHNDKPQPDICLQETPLKEMDKITFKGYNTYNEPNKQTNETTDLLMATP